MRRIRDQVELSAEARRENVSGAFVAWVPVAGRVLTRGWRVHDRRHPELVRWGIEESGREEGTSPDPAQDCLSTKLSVGSGL